MTNDTRACLLALAVLAAAAVLLLYAAPVAAWLEGVGL